MKDCIFCKIVNGDIPSMKVYEDDVVLAFLDVNPDCDGHTLVIPKKHYKDINDIDDDTLLHVYKVARNIGNMLTNKLGANGISYLQNNGDVQEVKHYHLHIKPYYKNKESIKMIKDEKMINNPEEIYEKIK